VLLIAAIALWSTGALEAEGYQRVAEQDGMAAYQQIEGGVIRVAAEGVVLASPEAVRLSLLDYGRQIGRVGRLAEARVLERGEDSLLVYQRLDLPLIDDRDYTLLVRWGETDGVLWVAHEAIHGGGPRPRGGAVRVVEHSGGWELHPIRGGEATLARFRNTIDLSGSLPTWLARSGAARELPSLFQGIRSLSAELAMARRRP